MTMPDVIKSLDNAYDHIQHEAYNDALSSILEAKQAFEDSQSKVDELLERQRDACAKEVAMFFRAAGAHWQPSTLEIQDAIRNTKIGVSDDNH